MAQEYSRQEILEEQKKFAMKYFDYAECPVQKWIANYLNTDVNSIFVDFKDNSDIISVKHENDYYTLYLSTVVNNFDIATMESSDSIKKAASLLYDAVRNVFVPVVKTISNVSCQAAGQVADTTIIIPSETPWDKTNLLVPMFCDKTMSFSLMAFNRYKMEKKNYETELNNICQQLERIKNQNIPLPHKKQAEGIKKQLITMQVEVLKKLNDIPDEKIEAVDKQCEELNKTLANLATADNSACKLYMHLEKNIKPTDETIGSRLPSFGFTYQDPTEDNYIDDLRKIKIE